jgi:uncharacterized protein (DUF1778 family)
MGAKTSQLQIRVTPEQKGSLKRLAASAEMSVSQYVLSRLLPSTSLELGARARALGSSADRHRALSDLLEFVGALKPDELSEAVAEVKLGDLSPVVRNYVAAVVEQEAWRKQIRPPQWVADVAPPDRAHFAWELRSLRPYLMRVTPPAFKRRNVFVAVDVPAAATAPDVDAGLDALSRELQAADVEAELCVVGGAVLTLTFHARPRSRRPDALFAPLSTMDDLTRRITEQSDLGPHWLPEAAKRLVEQPGIGGRFHERAGLRVFAAPPGYVLAMKCAHMRFVKTNDLEDAAIGADVRYLLRYLGLRSPADAMDYVARYLTERQHPPDLSERVAALLQ